MNKIGIYVTFLGVLLLSSCQKYSDGKSELLKPLTSVSKLGDSTFLVDVMNIEKLENQYYICDFTNNRVLVCDSLMNVLRVIGGKGNGPGEFEGAVRSVIKGNRIFVFDDGNRRLNIFNNRGNFLRSSRLPKATIANYRFAVDDSAYIYLSDPRLGYPIAKFDTLGNLKDYFGQLSKNGSSTVNRMDKSGRHLLDVSGRYILSIGNSEPIIEFYYLDGTIAKSHDLSDEHYFKPRLSYISKEYEKGKTDGIYSVIEDAYYSNGHLYLLYLGTNDQERPNCNKVLDCIIEGTNLKIMASYELGGTTNQSLWCTAISEGNHPGEIVVYSQNTSELNTYLLK